MKALMKMSRCVGDVALNDVDEPAVTEDTLKVHIKYCGICGTDLLIYNDAFKYYPPVIMGHEASGEVVETGKNIKGVNVGNRVSILGSTMVQCGVCEFCRKGMYMFCAQRRGMGHGVDGMFTKYVTVREDQCYKLPSHTGFQEGALMEPFGTAVQAVEEVTDIHAGDVALVNGPGPIGLMCAAMLVKKGCYVIVAGTEKDDLRFAVARKLGVHHTVDITKESLGSFIGKLTAGRGVDVAVEASGNAAAIPECLSALKVTGTYIQTGITGKPEVNAPFDMILYKQLRVFGSLGHSLGTWERMVSIYDKKLIDLTPLITHVLPLSEWESAFRLCRNGEAVKVLLYHE